MKESEHEMNEKGHWVTIHHLTMLGHKVADLEQPEFIVLIKDGMEGSSEFDTWCCMHHDCDYLEFRLKEGHREDR